MSEVQTRTIKTLAEKIEAAKAKVAVAQAALDKLVEQQKIEEALANIGAGDVVTFEAGRAETRREVTGTVLAAYDVDGKRKVKVLAGEGANAELFEVAVAQLISAAVEPAEQPAELAPSVNL